MEISSNYNTTKKRELPKKERDIYVYIERKKKRE